MVPYLKKRKLLKYYNRESMAAVLAAAELLGETPCPPDTPFYYASAEVENEEDYAQVFSRYLEDGNQSFRAERYIEVTPPVFLFKMMRNMASCFISIENGLVGDNTVLIDSAQGLLLAGMTAPAPLSLIGAGYLHADGSVEAALALMSPAECAAHPLLRAKDARAIEIFRP